MFFRFSIMCSTIQSESERLQMSTFSVTRAQLKTACDENNWDLLDTVLELDASQINDRSMYTDSWGAWWGLLLEVVRHGWVDGLRVLL